MAVAFVLLLTFTVNLYQTSNASVSNLNSTIRGLDEENANLSSKLSSLELQVAKLDNETARLLSLSNLSESKAIWRYEESGFAGQGETIIATFTAIYPGYLRIVGQTGGDMNSYVKVFNSFTGRNETMELVGKFDVLAAVLPGKVTIFWTWDFGDIYLPESISMNGTYYY